MVTPEFIEFDRWAASLVTDFPRDDIPIPPPEAEWHAWARVVASRPTFVKNLAPWPDDYEGWREWAFGLWRTVGNA